MVRSRTAPKQLRAKRTQRHLLEAARTVFAERGYDAVTVDDIALAAGCSKGAYYFHFASKEEALLAVLDEWVRQRTARFERALAPVPSPTASNSPGKALLPTEGRHREGRLLLELWCQAERRPQARRRLAQAYRSWHKLLARALPRDQSVVPERAAWAVLALHDGLLAQDALGIGPRAPLEERADALAALLTTERSGRMRIAG